MREEVRGWCQPAGCYGWGCNKASGEFEVLDLDKPHPNDHAGRARE